MNGNMDVTEDYNKSIFIQHISLPLGGLLKIPGKTNQYMQNNLETIDVFLPEKCKKRLDGICSDESLLNNNTTATATAATATTPKSSNTTKSSNTITKTNSVYGRYFINITNHIKWYEERGVTVKPIAVIRDNFFHSQTTLKKHCGGYTVACNKQYNIGQQIIKETIYNKLHNNNNNNKEHNIFNNNNILIVSYETLMMLQDIYLIDYIYKSLNINSTYVPEFVDGNLIHAQKMILNNQNNQNNQNQNKQQSQSQLQLQLKSQAQMQSQLLLKSAHEHHYNSANRNKINRNKNVLPTTPRSTTPNIP
jgi:RecG-like helicase